MDNLMNSYQLAYLPGHTIDNNKNVVILCLIPKHDITSSNTDIIISSKINCIINIIDKKMNEYNSAVNSYDNNCHIFKKMEHLSFEIPLRFYTNIKNTFNIHKSHKINKIIEYNELGKIIFNGYSINGLFSGKTNTENIKDGIIK